MVVNVTTFCLVGHDAATFAVEKILEQVIVVTVHAVHL